MKKNQCVHCWPTKRSHHLASHASYYLEGIANIALKPLERLFAGKIRNVSRYLPLIAEVLSFAGITRFTDEPDESKLRNRSLIFFREAKKRRLDIAALTAFGNYPEEFRLRYKRKEYYYEGIPLAIWPSGLDSDMDDKENLKKLLGANGVPVPRGRVFVSAKKALAFGKELGFPLAVKPRSGSLSYHVTCPINSGGELADAIRVAKKYRPDFIVEKYVRGKMYRATVVGRKYVFTCEKDPANVVGDGRSSIKDLVEAKNRDERRGETKQKNTSLHKIPWDATLECNLSAQGLGSQSILPKGRKIYLQDKFILSLGCDIIGCTDAIHEDNRGLFLRIADLLQTDLVGLDFICPDITKSYKKQEAAVLEANSLPYLDMHQYPSGGKADSVAEIVWDMVLEKLDGAPI